MNIPHVDDPCILIHPSDGLRVYLSGNLVVFEVIKEGGGVLTFRLHQIPILSERIMNIYNQAKEDGLV